MSYTRKEHSISTTSQDFPQASGGGLPLGVEAYPLTPVEPGTSPNTIPPMRSLDRSSNLATKQRIGLGVVGGLLAVGIGAGIGANIDRNPATDDSNHQPDVPAVATHEVEVNEANKAMKGQVATTVRNAIEALQTPQYAGVFERDSDGFYFGNKPHFNTEKFAGKDRKYGTADDPAGVPPEIDVNWSKSDGKIYLGGSAKTYPGASISYNVIITPDAQPTSPQDILEALEAGAFRTDTISAQHPDGTSIAMVRDSVKGEYVIATNTDEIYSLSDATTTYDIEKNDGIGKKIAHEADTEYKQVANDARNLLDATSKNIAGK